MSSLFGAGSITIWASDFGTTEFPWGFEKDDILLKKVTFDTLFSGSFTTNNGTTVFVDVTADSVQFEADGEWSVGTNFKLRGEADDMLGKSLDVLGFAHINVNYLHKQSTVGVEVNIDGAKGGLIKMTDFDDTLNVGVSSDGAGHWFWGHFMNKFIVKTYDGDDHITFESSANPYHVGGVLNDTTGQFTKTWINAGAGDDTVDTSALDSKDYVFGRDGHDVILGGGNNDKLRGDRGDDFLDGGAGDDDLRGHKGMDIIIGGEGSDNIRGGHDDDYLVGDFDFADPSEDPDNLSKGDADRIKADKGDDTILGGVGDDYIHGGHGFDTAKYRGDSTEYTITSLGGKKFQVSHNMAGPNGDEMGLDGTDFLIHVESLMFTNGMVDLVGDPGNTAPAGSDDKGTGLKEDVTMMVSGDAILGDLIGGNADFDAEGDTMFITEVNGVAIMAGGTTVDGVYGDLFINPNGQYTYTLDNGADGDGNSLVQQFGINSVNEDDFFYTLSDGQLTDSDVALTMEIIGTNDKPVVGQGIAHQTVDEDTLFNFEVPMDAFKDIDTGDELGLMATLADGSALPDWLSFDPMTNIFSGMPGNDDVGVYDIKVIADDGHGDGTAEVVFQLEVVNVNDAPIAQNVSGAGTANNDLAVVLDAEDVDLDDQISYGNVTSQTPGFSVSDNGNGTVSLNPDEHLDLAKDQVRIVSFTYLANDLSGTSSNQAIGTFTVIGVNDAPTFDGPDIGDQTYEEGEMPPAIVDLDTLFSDIDTTDMLSYSYELVTVSSGGSEEADVIDIDVITNPGDLVETPAPEPAQLSWLDIDVDGNLIANPMAGDAGTHSIRIVATDMELATAVSNVFQIVVEAPAPNLDPVLGTVFLIPSITQGTIQAVIDLDSLYTDPEGDPITYGVLLPAGFTFDPATNIISTTTSVGAGDYTLQFWADDDGSAGPGDVNDPGDDDGTFGSLNVTVGVGVGGGNEIPDDETDGTISNENPVDNSGEDYNETNGSIDSEDPIYEPDDGLNTLPISGTNTLLTSDTYFIDMAVGGDIAPTDWNDGGVADVLEFSNVLDADGDGNLLDMDELVLLSEVVDDGSGKFQMNLFDGDPDAGPANLIGSVTLVDVSYNGGDEVTDYAADVQVSIV